MPDAPLLIILSPPRSFSSVVGGMLGQHPEMYGLPELNLFAAPSVFGLREVYRRAGDQAPHGLLRALAEIHEKRQDEDSVERARAWLKERTRWSTKQVMDHILAAVAPRMGVEKSPRTVMRADYLERSRTFYPDAFYLHLTRHPRPTALSQIKITSRNERWGGKLQASKINPDRWWLRAQQYILTFLADVPLGQWMRIRGEDLLSAPDTYLPQIADWLGLRSDEAAIEAMKHPERSPYARLGPKNAPYGNDVNYLESPALRKGTIPQASLDGPLEWAPHRSFTPETIDYARFLGYS